MTGAALRAGALVFAVCSIAAVAWGTGTDVTNGDRLWANFSREAAVVGSNHFWLELRGMALMDDQDIKQTDSTGKTFEGPTLGFAGYPVNKPHCTASANKSCIESIDGGRFDLVGAYGLGATAELGFDLPFVMTEKIDYTQPGSRDRTGIGDLLLYGKIKKDLAEHWAGALGLEISTATGSDNHFFGAGATGLNPFLSTRYASGPFAFGGHVGFLINTGNPPDVFNWDVDGIVRGNQSFALRCEINGRVFREFGETFNDAAIYPGVDFNLTDAIIIRPTALAHLSTDAINWGVGIGFVFTM